jgi:hypothetical protein
LGPAFSVAQAIEPIGEVTGNFASVAQLSQQFCGTHFTLLIKFMDEILGEKPVRRGIR